MGNWLKTSFLVSTFILTAAISISSQAQVDPVAHWKLDESSGTSASDSSGNGNTGTLVGGPVWTAGQFGGGLSFDGNNDRVDTASAPLNPSATDFSATIWFKADNLDDEHFISQMDGSGTGRVWLAKSSSYGVYSNLGNSVTSSSFVPTVGQWHHAALTKSGSTIKIYIDGVLQVTNSGVTAESATGALRIGSKKTGTDNFYDGVMDDIRIYDRELTSSEVLTLAVVPIAHWKFDETSGTTAGDASGNGYTGTLINGPSWATGKIDGALVLDGSNDRIDTSSSPFNPSSTDFSVALWFKAENVNNDEHFLSQADGSGTGRTWIGKDFSHGVYSNLGGSVSGNPRIASSYVPLSDQWTHVVLTSIKTGSTATVRIYVNGVIKTTYIGAPIESATGVLRIGSNKSGSANYFNGAIDDLRIYNQALSDENVFALYSSSEPSTPVAHWKFNESSGTTAIDASGNGYSGSLVNGPAWVAGQIDGGISFDGSNDRVDVTASPVNPGITDFSAALWFKADNLNDQHFISQADGTGTGRVWLAKDSTNGVYSYLGQTMTSSSFIPTIGQWHHAAITKSGSTIKIYVDGQLRTTNNSVTVENASGGLRIGSNKAGTANFLDGSMDDVRIYDRVLSSDEILSLYQAWTTWGRWETSLTSGASYGNPYADVTVSVTYTGPNSETFTGNAFWDGGNIFRLRAMFPAPGTWTWTTSSSDTGNSGLHNRSGSLTVAAYSGNNPLYVKGYPKVSGNNRYLTYGDNTPFLWMGDTAWSAPITATQAEWESYIQLRKSQRFNVIQVHTRDGWVNRDEDTNSNPPFTGSDSTLTWNPEYWQGVEKKVQYANDQGLMVFFTAVRQPLFPDSDDVDSTTHIQRFARNLVARMMGNFVVFSPVADDLWTSLADDSGNELAASTSVHLVTAHPRFFLSPAETFHDKSYADFSGLQSGAGWTYDPYFGGPRAPFEAPLACQNAIEWTLGLYNRSPTKPVIDLEVVYDSKRLHDGNTTYYKSPYPTRLPRSTAYLAMLSGSAGITYGAGGVWDWGIAPNGNATSGWSLSQALGQASATQMQYLYDLFSGLSWWNLVPAHGLIQNQSTDWLNKMVMAKTSSGELGVAYLPDNTSIELDMSAFSGSMTATWFNPVTNASEAEPSTVANSGTHTFSKPSGWGDAVLVLTDE